mmetsp:Transcript_6379/g.18213  ORF Transcript_6379/g.18213 Transcript_6379/m.18213 type:complete len:190 (-) Transcript_6379:4226-4795(-)
MSFEILDLFGYTITCSLAVQDVECHIDGAEEYPWFGTVTSPDRFLTWLVPIILSILFRKLKTAKNAISCTASTMRTIPKVLAGMLYMVIWFDKQREVALMLLGPHYSDGHTDWIKWVANVFTGWYYCTRILKWALSFRWKKFTLFLCFILAILFVIVASDTEKLCNGISIRTHDYYKNSANRIMSGELF